MKIPQYRFVDFPSTGGGTWRLTAESREAQKINAMTTMRVKPSPVPTVALLFILSLYGVVQ
jgi:hypothetical protein